MHLRVISRVISPQQADLIASKVGPREFFEDDIIGITSLVQSLVPVDLTFPSYCCVESKPDGHGWHTDRGNNGHMPWCDYSVSILLTDPTQFTGGSFRTKDKSYVHYRDMLIYSNMVEHCVDPHEGDRRVLLMFLKKPSTTQDNARGV